MTSDLWVDGGVRIPRARAGLPANAVKRINTAGKHPDGGGLYLNVSPTGNKNWVVRYSFGGKTREAGLGAAGAVTLAAARIKAAEYRALAASGIDPLADRKKRAPLFGELVAQYIQDQSMRWTDRKAAKSWTGKIDLHAANLLPMPADEITMDDILAIMRPLFRDKPETGRKLRGFIERVFDVATARGIRKDNPARWKGGIGAILPPPKKLTYGHHKAMHYDDVPAFFKALQERGAQSARMLSFIILTAARSGEVRGAQWGEIDLDQAVWTIPANRMKARKEHRVPLTHAAIEIIEAQKAYLRSIGLDGGLVFPSHNGQAYSDAVFTALYKRMGVSNITTHGFRSTFRDWVGDKTTHARETGEEALAHVVGSAVERAYRRGSALDKRRALMQDWADYLKS